MLFARKTLYQFWHFETTTHNIHLQWNDDVEHTFTWIKYRMRRSPNKKRIVTSERTSEQAINSHENQV